MVQRSAMDGGSACADLCAEGAAVKPATMLIAVDGPAASGKGTIARALARHYGLPHMDTGLLYRAVGLALLRAGLDPADAKAAAAAATACDSALMDDPAIRSDEVARAASIVSALPAVRSALLARQRDFAAQAGGAVLDGRDIGTVIAPEAKAKLFVTASPPIRAQRRHKELVAQGRSVRLEEVEADILARDARDSERSSAPLVQAADAALLDTSNMDIETAVSQAIALVEARLGLTATGSAS